ncbi:MAG: hypothetical protein AAF092_02885 [Pseudomonadota bacterium]
MTEFDPATHGLVPITKTFAAAAIGDDPGLGDFYIGVNSRWLFSARRRYVRCYRYDGQVLRHWDVFELYDRWSSPGHGFLWAVLPESSTFLWVDARLEVVDFERRRNANFDFELQAGIWAKWLKDITFTDGVVSVNVAGAPCKAFWVQGHAYAPLRGASLDLELRPGARVGILNPVLPGKFKLLRWL